MGYSLVSLNVLSSSTIFDQGVKKLNLKVSHLIKEVIDRKVLINFLLLAHILPKLIFSSKTNYLELEHIKHTFLIFFLYYTQQLTPLILI